MREGIQTFLQEAGESACYALSIIKIAEEVLNKEFPCAESLLAGIDKKYIRYNWQNTNDNNNFYVENPAGFLSFLTGRKCSLRIENNTAYKAKKNEYTVQCWQRNKTGQLITHFRRPKWDSLVSSVTIRQGKIASLRIFTVNQEAI
jgi:hypothetical protein